jgi:hypothetical protein
MTGLWWVVLIFSVVAPCDGKELIVLLGTTLNATEGR